MNGFIDWHLRIKNLFSHEVVNKYNRLIDSQIDKQRHFFYTLYDDEFLKLNVEHLFMLKSKEAFQLQIMTKVKCLTLIKTYSCNKSKNFKKTK